MSNYERLVNTICSEFEVLLDMDSLINLKNKLIETILINKKRDYIENDEYKTYYFWLCRSIADFAKEYGLRLQLLRLYSKDSFPDLIVFENHLKEINLSVYSSFDINHFIKYTHECDKKYENVSEKEKLSDLEFNYLVFDLKNILLYKLMDDLVMESNEQLLSILKRCSDEEIHKAVDNNIINVALSIIN